MRKAASFYTIIISFLMVSGCSSTMQYSEEKETALEKYNHAMFTFNNKVDKAVVRPVAKGYRKITNQYIRQRITNFFNNISEPVSMVNHLLQGEIHNSGENFARFVVNSTVGGLGLYDVASKAGLKSNSTGFDETMASWCLPDGPYVVLPFIGPSTPRAAMGWVADGYTSPMYWVANESHGEDAMNVYYGAVGLKYLNKMAENVNLLEKMEESSIDYYETIKSAYMQNRGKIRTCSKLMSEASTDYDFDMDEEY